MSTGFSIFVIILTLITVGGSLWLLFATGSQPAGTNPEETTGHTWDDDLQEYNKPLPRWWLWLFVGTAVFAVVYVILFPGFGNKPGILGWTSEKQLQEGLKELDAASRAVYAKFEGLELAQLASDPKAQELGRNLFANNCATCHGSDARGNAGFPNLVDADWQWGGEADTILTTILDGRTAAMPGWAAALGGEQGVKDMVEHVKSLSGRSHDSTAAGRAAPQYAMFCVACHGADGTGNALLGAPNLTDNVWLYGADSKSLYQTIAEGRNGVMPAHRQLLGENRVRVVASWIYAQSRSTGAVAQQQSAQ